MPRDHVMLFPEVRVKRRPTLDLERRYREQGYQSIAGVDEAGAGPLAGPVVAAAVILPERVPPRSPLYKVRDSKLLRPEQREELYKVIAAEAVDVTWDLCSAEEIDQINIYNARFEAMTRAVGSLMNEPGLCLVDGNRPLPCRAPSVAVVKGDRQCLSIAAASVVAKVIRDAIMDSLDRLYPAYGFAAHKGYATAEHFLALRAHGPCPAHRRSFQPVRECLEGRPTIIPTKPAGLFD